MDKTFVKHLYIHKFPFKNVIFLTIEWKEKIFENFAALVAFHTGYFALRGKENIVEFLEGQFRNKTLSFFHKKENWAFSWAFPFHLCLLPVYL